MPGQRKSTVLLEHHLKQLKLPTMLSGISIVSEKLLTREM